MADNVLIDTSVWIDFFRDRKLTASQHLINLLDQDRAVLTGIVVTELLRGARNLTELKSIRKLLQPVPVVSPNEQTWEEAGTLAFYLFKKGYEVFTVDAVIAVITIQNELALFSLDKHFSYIARHSDLKLYSPR